ncbi:hypothetical protein GJAV_G00093970 [Gymnothorax javanicus]|nr:hypothetical protein GJAV_G00093970 [Gymnothorax javanicus]
MSCNRGARQVAFHSQLSPILEILVRTAVTEINKLVDDGTAVLRLEMSQSHREIETLKKKVQLLEHELRATRRSTLSRGPPQPVTVPILDELRLNTKDGRGIGQDWSFTVIRDGESADVGVDAPVHSGIKQNQYASTKKVRTDPVPIKEERLDDGMSYTVQKTVPTTEEEATQSIPVEYGQKKDTTPVGDPEELREQHRCGHGDEELSGLDFVVKAEQEEEHVAQRLNQTGCELGAGRLNTLDSEYVMYERDNQLWTSFAQGNSDIEGDDSVCFNAAEQCSQSLSVHSPIHHTPAYMEGSGNPLSSFGASYAEQFDKMGEKPSVCGEELRSEAVHTQQGQYRERLVHTVERENQTLLPQQQQHGPSVKHRRGSESPAQPHSGSQYETSYALSPGAVNMGRNARTDKRAGMSLNINPSMSNFVTFQTQLVSIMEILAKAAVAEINRCVDDSCAVFRLEITQSQREIEALKHKLRVLERELLKTGHRKKVRSPALVENPSPAERVSGQDWCIGPKGRERFTEDSQDVPPAQHSITTDRIRPLNIRSTDQLPIKRERPEGGLCCSDPLPACAGDEQETELVLVGDSLELREQHRCGHSDEELSGLEFVVKAEQEEEHVAQRLNQTGCELSAGRLNTLDSGYMMYERDNQLSMSSIDGEAPEQCSQSLSIQSPLPHTAATMEVSGIALSSFGASYAEEFDKVVEKPSVCSEELRSEAVHTQQGQYRERLEHTVERENQTLLPQQQQHGPSVKHRRGSESPAQPHSGSQYETGSAQSTGAVNTGKRSRCEGLPVKQERLEEDIYFSDEQLTSSAEDHVTQTMPIEHGKKPDIEPTPVRDPEELTGHGDEELSRLEFVVKAEQEEDVAQRLNHTGCELSAGRLNTLGSDCVMYERDNRLWSSCALRDSVLGNVDPVCSDATEQSSRSLSIQSPIHHTSATMEVSGNTLSSPETSYAEFDGMGERPSVCSEELRSEAILTQQAGGLRPRPLSEALPLHPPQMSLS